MTYDQWFVLLILLNLSTGYSAVAYSSSSYHEDLKREPKRHRRERGVRTKREECVGEGNRLYRATENRCSNAPPRDYVHNARVLSWWIYSSQP